MDDWAYSIIDERQRQGKDNIAAGQKRDAVDLLSLYMSIRDENGQAINRKGLRCALFFFSGLGFKLMPCLTVMRWSVATVTSRLEANHVAAQSDFRRSRHDSSSSVLAVLLAHQELVLRSPDPSTVRRRAGQLRQLQVSHYGLLLLQRDVAPQTLGSQCAPSALGPIRSADALMHQENGWIALGDDKIPNDGPLILKGDLVRWGTLQMGYFKHIWGPDAAEWKPERWIDDESGTPTVRNEPAHKFHAFNSGKRLVPSCP